MIVTLLCILGLAMAAGCVATAVIALCQAFGRIPLPRRKE